MMTADLQNLVATERGVLAVHAPWMGWNLLLAVIPLLLTVVLFRPGRRRGLLWWAGVAIFVAFLPNAAYVITDAIHLAQDLQRVKRPSVLYGSVIPLYVAYFAAGLACYSGALIRLRRYLDAQNKAALAVPAELSLHLLAAVGIFLGRVDRLNSWDILARPMGVVTALIHLAGGRPASGVVVLLVVVVVAKATTVATARVMRVSLRWLWKGLASPGSAG